MAVQIIDVGAALCPSTGGLYARAFLLPNGRVRCGQCGLAYTDDEVQQLADAWHAPGEGLTPTTALYDQDEEEGFGL